MNTIDLHVHSTCSDGTLTPAELVTLASSIGLSAFALTDHDSTDGIAEALRSSAALPDAKRPDFIPGIEFSTQALGSDIHIFGLDMLIVCLCPLIIKSYGNAYLSVDYASIFLYFLMGSCYIAISMFLSSLTESQIIAAVGSFGLLLLLYLWDGLVGFLPSTAVGSLLGFFVVLILVCFLINALSNNWKVTAGVLVAGAAVLIAFSLRDSSVLANLLPDVLGQFSLLSAFDSFSRSDERSAGKEC